MKLDGISLHEPGCALFHQEEVNWQRAHSTAISAIGSRKLLIGMKCKKSAFLGCLEHWMRSTIEITTTLPKKLAQTPTISPGQSLFIAWTVSGLLKNLTRLLMPCISGVVCMPWLARAVS